MKIADIQHVGTEVLKLLAQYHNPPHKELLLDVILLAYLSGRYSGVARQHHVRIYGSPRPQRIDFRFGGTNPVVMELAVRSPTGGGALYGSQNTSELRKLCRVNRTQARLRALLLLDLADAPLKKGTLKQTFDEQHAGPGNFRRSSVRVIYVHRRSTYHFSWTPFRQ